MSIVKLNGSERELKFTFNSFKYMQEFNIGDLNDIEKHPFKMVAMIEMLLMGAFNNDPKVKVSDVDVQQFLEEYTTDGNITELFSKLLEMMQDSSFFKSLQKNA